MGLSPVVCLRLGLRHRGGLGLGAPHKGLLQGWVACPFSVVLQLVSLVGKRSTGQWAREGNNLNGCLC